MTRHHHEAAQTIVQLLPAAIPLAVWLRIRIAEKLTVKREPPAGA